MYICRYTLSNYDFVLDNSIFCNWMQTRRSDSWYHRSCNCYRSNSAPLHHEKIRRIKCGTANAGRNRRYTCLTAYNGYKPVRNWSGSWISKSNHSSNKHSIQLSCKLRIEYVQLIFHYTLSQRIYDVKTLKIFCIIFPINSHSFYVIKIWHILCQVSTYIMRRFLSFN